MPYSMTKIGMFAAVCVALVACGGGRDVEVKGEATGAGGPIQLEFYEIDDDGKVGDSVDTLKLDAAGSFTKTVKIEGKAVRVLAIADANGDAKCSTGEAWGEAKADINDDDELAAPLKVELRSAACP